MRVVLQLLFLFFYVASSYAITGKRVSLIVQEIQHSTSRTDRDTLDDGCKQLHNNYPRYSEAKKIVADKDVRPILAVYLPPAILAQRFTPVTGSFQSEIAVSESNPRAPPVL